MKLMLTSCGIETQAIQEHFLRWLNKSPAEAKALFIRLGAETLVCEGSTYWFLHGEEPAKELPQVRLLAGFDPLMLGYRKEDNPFLPPEHLRGIFNLAGIVNPAILLGGRVVGKWKESKGKVELTAFESIGARDRRRIEREAERLYTVRKLIWK